MITTELTRLMGIDHPIVLAPMGGVAGGRLAAAVANAGGLGLLGAGYGDPDSLAHELALAGDARIGVGFITFALDRTPDSLRLALDHQPIAVQLSFGDPAPYVEQIHDAGAALIVQIQTVADARHAAGLGADVIVAQGQDSGGHGRPGRGTISLVPAIVDAVAPVPVVAAGGLADGRGLVAALALGAAGITLGTRFFASSEGVTDANAARLLTESSGDDTTRTTVFDVIRGPAWPDGHDGRSLRNRTTERWGGGLADHESTELASEYRAADETDYAVKALWAGEGLDLIRSIESAADIIASVVAQANRVISEVSGLDAR